MDKLRKCLSVTSIILGGTAVAIPDYPDLPISKILIALGTSCNAAALWLMKDIKTEADGTLTIE